MAATTARPQFSAAEVLDGLGQAVIATDLAGVIGYWNRAAEQIYGWSADEACGRNIADVTVPQVSQEIAADIMAALRAGQPWSGGFPVQRRDGSVFPALVTDAGIHREGAMVGIVGVSANLGTALHPLLERSADAALVLDRDGIVTFASPAVEALFGWQVTDLLGKPLTDRTHPYDQESLHTALGAAEASSRGRLIELRLDTDDGWLWAEAALTNLLDDPVVRGVVVNLRHSERLVRLEERDRISRSMHVDILQTLFGAGLDLDAVVGGLEGVARARVESALDAVGTAITTLRDLVRPERKDADPAPPRDAAATPGGSTRP